jgi:hypothetical protein
VVQDVVAVEAAGAGLEDRGSVDVADPERVQVADDLGRAGEVRSRLNCSR